MSSAQAVYPYLNLQFRLVVGEQPLGSFSECTGLALELTTEDYHEGGENRFVHKFPAVGQPPNLVLKRGLAGSDDLWKWFVQYLEQGTVEPKDGQIELLGRPESDLEPVRVWTFTRGYPVKWTGPELNAVSGAIAFETVELVHRGLRAKEV